MIEDLKYLLGHNRQLALLRLNKGIMLWNYDSCMYVDSDLTAQFSV